MTTHAKILLVAASAAAMLALPAAASAQAPRALTVTLATQSSSGVAGSATLTDIGGGRTRVEVRVSTGGNPNMPGHFHEGTCANLNPAPKITLTSVQNGTSTTEVNATIASILAAPHAINLHKSPQELPVYTACGNVVAGAAAFPATGAGPTGTALPAVLAAGLASASAAGAAVVALRRRFR
jgi:hypothetical protein